MQIPDSFNPLEKTSTEFSKRAVVEQIKATKRCEGMLIGREDLWASDQSGTINVLTFNVDGVRFDVPVALEDYAIIYDKIKEVASDLNTIKYTEATGTFEGTIIYGNEREIVTDIKLTFTITEGLAKVFIDTFPSPGLL